MKILKFIKNLIFKSCENCYYENYTFKQFPCNDCSKDGRCKRWLKG